MKKTFTNADITAINNVLNTLKSRDDIVIGDMSIFWAIKANLKTFTEASTLVKESIDETVQKYFTDENSDIVGDQKVLKEEYREETVEKINADVRALNFQTTDVEIKAIERKALEKFTSINAEKLAPVEITVLDLLTEEEE